MCVALGPVSCEHIICYTHHAQILRCLFCPFLAGCLSFPSLSLLECFFLLADMSLLSLLASFHVGEFLEKGIENAIVLGADEALVLHAIGEFDDVMPDGMCV